MQLHNWQARKSINSLILFLIWLYEFLEVISVNNTGMTANRKSAITVYPDSDIVAKLFAIRGTLVHKFWKVTDDIIIDFYQANLQELAALVNNVCTGDVSCMLTSVLKLNKLIFRRLL